MTVNARICALIGTCLCGLVAFAVPAAGATAATAVPPAGWSRYDGWAVHDFAVTGLPPGMGQEGGRGLRLFGQWKLLRGRTRPEFKAGILGEDLRRIRLYLARRGYPASRAEVLFVADTHARRLGLEVRVDPGPPVLLHARHFEGWPAGVAIPDSTDVHLPPLGEPLVDEDVENMVGFVRDWLRDAGYADTRVAVNLVATGPGQVDLHVVVEPGEYFTIGRVEITGCSADLEPVARRVMDIEPGDPFGGTLLVNAATDLRTTQLFGQVELVTEPTGPGELALTAHLTDARMRSWRASVGSWSDNPWLVRAGWDHRNLLGRGRGFDVRGTYATHLQNLGAEAYILGFLSPRARTSLGSAWQREDEDAYVSEEYRLELVQAFRPRDRALMNLGIGLSVNDVEVRSPDVDDLPEDQDLMLEIWFDRKWDWTDDMIFPTRGSYFKLGGIVAPPAPVWGNAYAKLQLDGSVYQSLFGPFILAARGRFGWSQPLGTADDLLANRRFYAGGYNTMRGYERRRLGPRDSDDNPRGGQATILAGVELRSRMVWILDLAAFVDVGQVWRYADAVDFADLAVAAGLDLDLRTPLGPLRVGYAWNLTEPFAAEPAELWHFGIGYPW